jgi:hypothetical protein
MDVTDLFSGQKKPGGFVSSFPSGTQHLIDDFDMHGDREKKLQANICLLQSTIGGTRIRQPDTKEKPTN